MAERFCRCIWLSSDSYKQTMVSDILISRNACIYYFWRKFSIIDIFTFKFIGVSWRPVNARLQYSQLAVGIRKWLRCRSANMECCWQTKGIKTPWHPDNLTHAINGHHIPPIMMQLFPLFNIYILFEFLHIYMGWPNNLKEWLI